jgi:hypothetical protein
MSGDLVMDIYITPTEKEQIAAPDQFVTWGNIIGVLEGN